MKNYQAGMKVLCIRNVAWRDAEGDMVIGGPANGTIYLVDSVTYSNGLVFLALSGEIGWWDSDEFRQIVPLSEQVTTKQNENQDEY